MKYFIHISTNIVKETQGLKTKKFKKKTQTKKTKKPTKNALHHRTPTHSKPRSLDIVYIVHIKHFNTLNYYRY